MPTYNPTPGGSSSLITNIYKNSIYYADANAPLSNEAISAAEATSVGNALESLSFDIPAHVTSEAERNSYFPNPVQGNGVYRLDLGWEERYFEEYASKTNPNGKTPAGWYRVNGGLHTIVPTSISAGTGSYSVRADGLINFTNASKINLTGNIFNSNYNFFEVEFMATGSSNAQNDFRYSNAGVDISSANYAVGAYQYGSAGFSVKGASGQTGFDLNGGVMLATRHRTKIIMSNPVNGGAYYPKIIFNTLNFIPGSSPYMRHGAGYYKSLVTAIDGFTITPNAGTLTGTISINGYL